MYAHMIVLSRQYYSQHHHHHYHCSPFKPHCQLREHPVFRRGGGPEESL